MWKYNHDDELCHYGVKGQKWGIRRYQNPDGTLTAAGKKRAKQEYRSDNKKAFELGKNATIYGNATTFSLDRTIRLENKLDKLSDKDPHGSSRRFKSLYKKWSASKKTTGELEVQYIKARDAAERHYNELIKKYGEEAVSKIRYIDVKLPKGKYSPDSIKVINERTNKASDYVLAGAVSVGMSLMIPAITDVPLAAVLTPKSGAQKGYDLERTEYIRNTRRPKLEETEDLRTKEQKAIDAKYSKKVNAAKSQEEKEFWEFEWMDALDEL